MPLSTYRSSIRNISDYSPFGVQLDGRTVESEEYRFGFQGQEKDDELKGEGNSVNYKFRMHDPRIGRFFAVDPLTRKYPHWSPYQFSGNQVIHTVELEGLETENNLNQNEIEITHNLSEISIYPTYQGKKGDKLGGIVQSNAFGYIYDQKLQVSNFADAVGGEISNARGWNGIGYCVYVPKDTELGKQIISHLEEKHGIKYESLTKKAKRKLLRVEWEHDSFWDFSTPDRSDLFSYKKSNVKLFRTLALPYSLPTTVPIAISPSAGAFANPGEVFVNIDVLGAKMADEFAKTKTSSDSDYNQESEHTRGKRRSTRGKHEKGQERKGKDKGGEKGDAKRKRYR